MKINEVRVGNLMAYGTTYATITVEHLETIERNPEYGAENYKPIPFSAEWMGKLHLWVDPTDADKVVRFPNSRLTGLYTFAENRLAVYDEYYYGFMPDIYYVHQLQNLYFSITGEEL